MSLQPEDIWSDPFPLATENSSVCREQTVFSFSFFQTFLIVSTQEYKVSAFLFSLAATAVNTMTEVNVRHMDSHRFCYESGVGFSAFTQRGNFTFL